MFAKYALVALMAAAVPLAGASTADAASRDGKKHEKSWVKSDHHYKGDHKSKSDYKSRKYTDYGHKKYSYYGHKKHSDYGHKHGKKTYKFWKHGKPYANHKCSAVAKKRYGFGRRIWGISGKGYGHSACDRAMYECRKDLAKRKASGHNRWARCVIYRKS